MMHGFAYEDPPHMRPALSVARCVRITLLVCEPVVNAVRSHLEDGSAFEAQRAAEGQKIFHPLGSSVPVMCEQPMIAHPDAQAPRYPQRTIATKKVCQVKKNNAAIPPI
jgi:hypothetical protein